MSNLKQKREVKVATSDDKEQPKLELEYPCNWTYKLVAGEKEALKKAIHDVIVEREHTLTHSNTSKTGKYISMNLDLVVQNEDERNFIYEALKAHQNIKMVL